MNTEELTKDELIEHLRWLCKEQDIMIKRLMDTCEDRTKLLLKAYERNVV